MKKFVSLFLATAFILGLTSCQTSQPASTSTGSEHSARMGS